MHRFTRWALASALALSLTALGGVGSASASDQHLSVGGLRVDDRTDQPLGVDDPTPTLSWRLTGTGATARQSAYEVRVSAGAGTRLWDSGRVPSTVQRTTYAGAALTSRTPISWQVRVWDGAGVPSAWSRPSSFEMGLLASSDWDGAKWIQLPPPPLNRGVTVDVGTRSARYVRLDVTKLGLPINESSYGLVSRVMLSEMQVLAPNGTNLALGRSVSVYDQFACPGCGTKLLTDGKIISPGYASRQSATQDVSPSKWVQIDLGSVQTFDRVVLFPRTDARTPDGKIPDFPVDFTIRASATSAKPTDADVVATVAGEPNPQGPDLENPLPIFAKPFDATMKVARARLYISGLGAYQATVNGKPVTDTVLNPGVTNPLRTAEYGTYDVTQLIRRGDNTLGVALGNGQTDVYPQTNAAVGRTDVYTKFNSTPIPAGTLTGPIAAGATTVPLSGVGGYSVGDTVNVDTGDGGSRLESRKVTAVDAATNTLSVAEAFGRGHAAGAAVLGSGSPSVAEMTVTPRLIARLELNYANGRTVEINTDPSWRVKHGPTVTDNWYAGTDFDATRVQQGWDRPDADLSAEQGWEDASITSAPSLDTRLSWRKAPPVRVQKTFTATSIKHVGDGSWSFDLGQNIAGMPQLHLPGGTVPAGTVITMVPGETASGNGAVSTATAGSNTGILDTYTSSGDPSGETFSPQFMYHGFQYVQISGLPKGFVPDESTLVGLQTNADVPSGGSITTDNDLINTIHSMSEYSIRSNMQSIFTDCPHREKLGWLADMIQSMGAIRTNFDVSSFLRTTEQNMLEVQQPSGLIPGTAPEFPNFGGGYRDDVNWGGAFILTPYELWRTYGDTDTMRTYYRPMKDYLSYVRAQISGGLLVSGLGDWIAGDTTTPKEATGTYGLFLIASELAEMADELGHHDDATDYRALAAQLADAFNARFFNPGTQSYTTAGPSGTTGSQTLDALPLAMGIVPAASKEAVLDDLEKRIYAYHPGPNKDGNGTGPHMSGGEVGLQPTYQVLMDNDRSQVLWDVLQEPSAPSYQNFVAAGRTTIPESWDMAGSQNHMILLQIDEWFNAGLSGIQQAPGSYGFGKVVIKPQVVGTLHHVSGTRETPYGTVTSSWDRDAQGVSSMQVTVPAGTAATVYVPAAAGDTFVATGGEARRTGTVRGYEVFAVSPGAVTFQRQR